jgi:hypothetical protein
MGWEKLVRVLQSIDEATQAGNIPWEATSARDTFQASFRRYSVLISKHWHEELQDHYIVFSITNERGEVVEEIDQGQASQSDYNNMEGLFDAARRTAMGVEEALDELLQDLEPLKRKRVN